MESLQNWALTVCITMIGSTIFVMLVPNSNMKKVVLFVINLFLISSLLSPILLQPVELSLSSYTDQIFDQTALTATMQRQIVESTENQLEQELAQVFTQSGYKFDEITIDISNTDCSLAACSVERVRVILPTEEMIRESDIRKIVFDTVGSMPEVAYSSF